MLVPIRWRLWSNDTIYIVPPYEETLVGLKDSGLEKHAKVLAKYSVLFVR